MQGTKLSATFHSIHVKANQVVQATLHHLNQDHPTHVHKMTSPCLHHNPLALQVVDKAKYQTINHFTQKNQPSKEKGALSHFYKKNPRGKVKENGEERNARILSFPWPIRAFYQSNRSPREALRI